MNACHDNETLQQLFRSARADLWATEAKSSPPLTCHTRKFGTHPAIEGGLG